LDKKDSMAMAISMTIKKGIEIEMKK